MMRPPQISNASKSAKYSRKPCRQIRIRPTTMTTRKRDVRIVREALDHPIRLVPHLTKNPKMYQIVFSARSASKSKMSRINTLMSPARRQPILSRPHRHPTRVSPMLMGANHANDNKISHTSSSCHSRSFFLWARLTPVMSTRLSLCMKGRRTTSACT